MKSSVPPVLIHPSSLLCSSECYQREKNCPAHQQLLLSCEAVSDQNETPIKFLLDYIHQSTLPKELFGVSQGHSKLSPYALLQLDSPADAANSFRSSRKVLACNVESHHQLHETPQKSQSPSKQFHLRSVQLIDSLSADKSLRKRQELSRELKNNPLLEEFLQLLVEQPLEDYVSFGHMENIGSLSINNLDSESSIKSKALTTKEGWSSEENLPGETISVAQLALQHHQSHKAPFIKPFIDGQYVGSQGGYDYAQSMLASLKESLNSLREVLDGKCVKRLFDGVQLENQENQEEREMLDNASLLSTRQLMSRKKIIQKSYHKKRMVDSC